MASFSVLVLSVVDGLPNRYTESAYTLLRLFCPPLFFTTLGADWLYTLHRLTSDCVLRFHVPTPCLQYCFSNSAGYQNNEWLC